MCVQEFQLWTFSLFVFRSLWILVIFSLGLFDPSFLAEEEVELQREAKTTFRKMPRNSLRSLSLNRRPDALARTAAATVFRSPSIYDEPRPFPVEEVPYSFRFH
jgi:hypothetical protein